MVLHTGGTLTHYANTPNCNNSGLSTTVRKDVTCKACLYRMGPDPEKLGGYHFPETRFVRDHPHEEIDKKMEEEKKEYLDAEPNSFHKIMELWDRMQVFETKLRKLKMEGADVEGARLAVFNGCRERGYYR
jgi:hypothetical protein